MATLTEVREQIAQKTRELHDIFAEAGPDVDLGKVTVLNGSNEYKAGEIKRRNDELTALGIDEDRLSLIANIGQQNETRQKHFADPAGGMVFSGNGSGADSGWQPRKTLRERITEHKGYQAFKAGHVRDVVLDLPGVDFKTLITLADISPQADRRATVDMPLEDRIISDLMGSSDTNSNVVEYFEETTVTNNATTVAEGSAKPESALDWTLRSEPIRKIGTFIPATKEVLDDVPQVEGAIRGRLSYMVRRVEEAQLLTGNGVGQNLTGLLNRSGIQTQAKGTDPNPDAVYKAMQKVRGSAGTGFAEPTAVVFNPNDWTLIKLLRTADGIYIWGNPSDEGPDRIWGKPVRQTTAMTAGTALVGAFRPWAEVLRREGISVTLSTEHSTFFVENKVAILAEERLGLAVYRPSAFCTVTGIA
jgi:hypothetical protein